LGLAASDERLDAPHRGRKGGRGDRREGREGREGSEGREGRRGKEGRKYTQSALARDWARPLELLYVSVLRTPVTAPPTEDLIGGR